MKNEFTYREKNGYLYPELSLSQQTHYPIGKYGNLRLMFIKEHRKGTYTSLLTACQLNEYLHQVDVESKEQVRTITAQLANARSIDENLKASNPMRWVQEMNHCKSCAEEMVMAYLYS